MKTRCFMLFAICILAHAIACCQTDKIAYASRASNTITIDGDLNEQAWASAKVITGFVQQEPNPSTSPSRRTEAKVLYDDKAIYIGAILYDDPDSILMEMSDRDQVGNADWFYVALDPYMSGTNGAGFLVSSGGTQFDARLSLRGEDTNWDAVWESEVMIHNEGWNVEIRIPYSALRFPDQTEQKWGFNLARKIKRLEEKEWWAEIDRDIPGFLAQFGQLHGINNIDPPLRLSATPFVTSSYAITHDDDKGINTTKGQVSGGLDIKYGINDAFTIDMTAIPDFGQVRSDDQVLNLSPFEVRFDENRPFFTEGVELFSKGGIFHSRRVGDKPNDLYNIEDDISDQEIIINNPQRARLINATKLSGRTNSGLGIGVFNAVERREYADVMNTETEQVRSVRTNPLTNYNVLVLDQNLKNNSSVSLINTNVLREGHETDANVTALTTTLFNKSNSYELKAGLRYSKRLLEDENETGHKVNIGISKNNNNLRWGVRYNEESAHYNPNDLGFLFSPNERNWSGHLNYFEFSPTKHFNRYGIQLRTNYSRLYDPNKFVAYSYSFEFWSILKNFWRFGVFSNGRPGGRNDYFEPRTDDFSVFYDVPAHGEFGFWVNTDERKKLFLNYFMEYEKFDEPGRYRLGFRLNPRWRVNDRFSTSMSLRVFDWKNDQGWVNDVGENIIFGQRDRRQYVAGLSVKYVFTNKMNIDLRARHNWTQVAYNSFSHLNSSGHLDKVSDYTDNHDVTFNSFTIDLVYRWRFLPGSDLFITYKNNLQDSQEEAIRSYTNNFKDLFSYSQSNSFSIKIIYYLDYLSLKKNVNSNLK